MYNYLYIAIGGALGAVSRFFLSNWINKKIESDFPWGTFGVNLLGSFIMGIFFILAMDKVDSPQLKLIVSVGFLGSFTTFSTFSLETFNLIKEDNILLALSNIGLSVALGLLAVWFGIAIGKTLIH